MQTSVSFDRRLANFTTFLKASQRLYKVLLLSWFYVFIVDEQLGTENKSPYRGNIALTDTNWQLNFDDLPGWDLLQRSERHHIFTTHHVLRKLWRLTENSGSCRLCRGLASFLQAPTLGLLTHYSDKPLRKRGWKMEFIFFDLRGSSTSLVRRRKGLLIAQEEGSLIRRPLWCSSLQPHGELISTWAIDRKRETWRGWREQKARGRAVAMWIHQHHIYLLLSDEVIPPVIEAQFWSIWLCLMHSWMSVYLELNHKVSRFCLKKVIESLI